MVDFTDQMFQPLASHCRDEDAFGTDTLTGPQLRDQIRFVEHRKHWVISGANFFQHLQDNFTLLVMSWIGNVDDVQKQISLHYLLECCAKCRHQLMRKLPDKSDCIR